MIAETVCAIGLSALLGYLAHRFYFAGGVCKSKTRLDGRVAIITGANTGIGYENALDFAKRGARVIMACRDIKKSDKAADKIRQIVENSRIDVEYLDLSDLSSIRSFAESMNSKLKRLDILINNAGVMMCPYSKTKNGFEMQFGVNHLGHFLLTNLLLDLIKKTHGSRIVNVSSLGHNFISDINWNDLNWEKNYSPIQSYAQSKLANILFTNELARRLEGTSTTVYSLHPGTVRTELTRHMGETIFFLLPYLMVIFHPIYSIFSKNSAEGAQTQIYCAVSDEAPKYNGCYFSDCQPTKPSVAARNKDSAKRLWEISEKLVGL